MRSVSNGQSYQHYTQQGGTQYVEELDFSGIEFPLQMKDVLKFEN